MALKELYKKFGIRESLVWWMIEMSNPEQAEKNLRDLLDRNQLKVVIMTKGVEANVMRFYCISELFVHWHMRIAYEAQKEIKQGISNSSRTESYDTGPCEILLERFVKNRDVNGLMLTMFRQYLPEQSYDIEEYHYCETCKSFKSELCHHCKGNDDPDFCPKCKVYKWSCMGGYCEVCKAEFCEKCLDNH